MPHVTLIGISAICDVCGAESSKLQYVLTEESRREVRTTPEAYQQAEIDLIAKGWIFQGGMIICPSCAKKQAAS